ncbi:MAG: pseudaminic acid cytidylyltransferase [Actinomycetota bacterium]|nr:pseudaminic acid cytidylyltransferase [Actinomycetota bacterium]
MTTNIALVPARGGSRRIPRKNLKEFLGVPAIARVIATLQQSGIFDRIVVSTDDQEIAGVARHAGADVPGRRPDDLADDLATTTEVVRHAIDAWLGDLEADARLWTVYPTAVLLTSKTLGTARAMFEAAGPDFLIPVLRYAHPVERRLRAAAGGLLIPDEPPALQARSQDLEPAFHDSGQFYVGTIHAWQQFTPLASGRNLAFELPAGSAIDIDEPAHWELAERLALESHS